jgi:hypothetical protein
MTARQRSAKLPTSVSFGADWHAGASSHHGRSEAHWMHMSPRPLRLLRGGRDRASAPGTPVPLPITPIEALQEAGTLFKALHFELQARALLISMLRTQLDGARTTIRRLRAQRAQASSRANADHSPGPLCRRRGTDAGDDSGARIWRQL